ncbi:hypothetical protein [Streptomyces sp. NRRL S-4]|uniref:hypothetical protein n=1 Tax=Streptomyces sp. NRRL S-4 TaxID=1519471 RepID=UPI000B1CCAFC|nr:hypothetical protein [Streptomyces sp. NRRL S-4]
MTVTRPSPTFLLGKPVQGRSSPRRAAEAGPSACRTLPRLRSAPFGRKRRDAHSPSYSNPVDDPFATRCGTRICLDGEERYVAGAKAYDPFTFGSGSGDTEAEHMDKARIDAHFARMRDDGVDVARLRMFSHEDWRGFEEGEGVYSEQQFVASPPARTT